MKNILFISPVFPDPNGAGREKRAHQWIMKLSKEYEIHLLVISTEEQKKEVSEVNTRSITVMGKKSPLKKVLSAASVLPLLFGRKSKSLLLGWVPLAHAAKEQLTQHYQHSQFDTIFCFRLYLKDYALFLGEITNCKVIELDLDDIESSTHLKIANLFLKTGHLKRALIFYLASINFRRNEKGIRKDFHTVYLCSDDDKDVLSKRLPNVNCNVMPNRIYGYPRSLTLPENPYQLLFIGSLNYFPNEEAVTGFVKKVLPELRKRNHSWVLHVVGHSTKQAFIDLLLNTEGVQYHGRVKSLEDIYGNVYQIISPLHAGGGTKLKVLEAMWYGRPIIATHESVYGLGLTPYQHYLPAEDAESFISACERLAMQPELADTLVNKSREILLEKYYY